MGGESESESHSVMSDSLRPHGLYAHQKVSSLEDCYYHEDLRGKKEEAVDETE